jgi:hydrogenase expression/formation protein HypE
VRNTRTRSLYVANEGKLIAIVAGEVAESLVARMKENPLGRDACIIGEVVAEPEGIVSMVTGFGGTRIVDMLAGEQLPRICLKHLGAQALPSVLRSETNSMFQ